MFIDQYNILTLEYHYYQNDCKYSMLKKDPYSIDHSGTLRDPEDEKVKHLLGIERYQKDDK